MMPKHQKVAYFLLTAKKIKPAAQIQYALVFGTNIEVVFVSSSTSFAM
jgi:hypothetical protein